MQPMHRREFVHVLLASAVGGNLAPAIVRAAQEGTAETISFGFSLYGMRSLTLDAALETCALIGYDAVELAVMPDWPGDPKQLSGEERWQLRDRLQELGLQLPALMEHLPLDGDDEQHRRQLDRLRAAAELGHSLSPDAPPLIETVLAGKSEEWEQSRQVFVDRLRDWAEVADQTHTVIAVKPHRMHALDTAEKAVWLIEQVNSPWIKLAYDYSHFQHREMPLADTLKTMLPHSRFIHVKDTVVENGTARFLLPGEGEMDYVDYFQRLQAAGYRGCVCVEVSSMIHKQPGYDPIATAQKCYDNLVPALEKAGIRRER